jgi:hypothetical protein
LMPLTEKELDAITGALVGALNPQPPDIRVVIQKAIAAAQEPELPPRPEWTVLNYGGDWYGLTGECRNPLPNEHFVTHGCTEVIGDMGDGLEPNWPASQFACGQRRWIAVKRPDTPPAGYEWDEARGWDTPKKGERWFTVEDARVGYFDTEAGDNERVFGWILKPAAPKCAFEKWLAEFKDSEEGRREHCDNCLYAAWKGFGDQLRVELALRLGTIPNAQFLEIAEIIKKLQTKAGA